LENERAERAGKGATPRASEHTTRAVRTFRRFGIRVTGNADASSVCPKRVAEGRIGAFSNTATQGESSVSRAFPDGALALSATRFSFYFNKITRFNFTRPFFQHYTKPTPIV
jgi:hypothetical protein